MNKQGEGKIEWTDYTWNPIAGCQHECRWRMPDNQVAVCYAETTANKIAQAAYPQGFAHHYYKPGLLDEPARLKTPAKIFCGSMADVFGHWVPSEQIEAVLKVCRETPWHTYQFLTKNAPRLKQFDFPPNCWVGISAPPTFMWGKELTREQQVKWMETACRALRACNARIRWLSAEPLSFCLVPAFDLCRFDWVVIGAASHGKTYYQPEWTDVHQMLLMADSRKIPVFFKGNLKWSPWRNAFPETEHLAQLSLF